MQQLKVVAGDLERLVASAQASEAQLEKLGDDLNRMGLEYAKLQKRVTTNDEWVESINGFRSTLNRFPAYSMTPSGNGVSKTCCE